MNNIDEFNKAVAMILTRLYDAFPHQIPMDFGSDDEDADTAKVVFYMSTMKFLEQEGFIRYKSQRLSGAYNDVSLTMKGLQILNNIPESLKEKKTIASHLKSVFKEGSKSAMRSAIDMVFKEALGD